MKYTRHNALTDNEINTRLNHCMECVLKIFNKEKEYLFTRHKDYEIKGFYAFAAMDIYNIPARRVTGFLKICYETVIKYANEIRDSYDPKHREMTSKMYEFLYESNLKIVKWKTLNRLPKKCQEDLYL